MKISEFILEVKSGNIDKEDYINKVIDEAKKINKEYNYFNTIIEKPVINKGKLNGLPVSVKDCICVKDIESTAGSKILKGYAPLFNATAVQNSIDNGAVIIGKTSQDEFGFGGFNINVGIDFKIPLNPFDTERVTGGSSGGAAGYTQKTKFAHFAIAESTGGSIVNPASFCGVVGLCPTYGLVSRYGLIDYANSLDKIGIMAKNVEDAVTALNIIKGYDKKDSTSIKDTIDLTKFLNKDVKGLKIGVIKESLKVDKPVNKAVWNAIKDLEKLGIKYKEISLPLTYKYGIACYYLLAMTEASTNLAKYCGMRYGLHEELKGNFNEYFSQVRSLGFGKEVKRRIILGTFARMAGFRDAYYLKAAKVRTLITQEYRGLFKKFDILLSPTMPVIAPKFLDTLKLTPLQNYMMDILTVGPNLAGLPHMTIPCGQEKGMPIGLMLIADHLKESKLIQVAGAYERK